ncbi:MAG: hypothetical protein WD801_16180 [Gemmatimonadaceae bacterium]
MKKAERPARWWILSLVVHGALVVALANVVFRYPLGQIMDAPARVRPERIQYLVLPAAPIEGSGSAVAPTSGGTPAPLEAPRDVPVRVPPPDTGASQSAGGTGSGRDADGVGLATGVEPRRPDPRIALLTGPIAHVPRSLSEDVDSIVSFAIGIYNDSMQIAARQRQPGDWSVKGKDGNVWGWDQTGIRLGKFSIPNALLALLPLNMSSSTSPIEARTAAFIRRDIMENARRAVSEDEFRAAVKRIRERKDSERRARQLAETNREPPSDQ